MLAASPSSLFLSSSKSITSFPPLQIHLPKSPSPSSSCPPPLRPIVAKAATRRESRTARHERVRKKVEGTTERPRMCVFRSNKHLYVQVIDDSKMHTLASASTMQKPISEEFDFSAGPTIGRSCQFIQCSSRSLSIKKSGKKEHHLWMKRDSAGSGQKALNLVHTVSQLPNEKETIYSALDKWTAWETEFPVVAAAKALEIMRRRRQWSRIIQVTKWLLNKGQVLTMGTYDTLLLAFDMERRVDEAETIWNMILQIHTRSVSKRLFSRMITLYDHHQIPEKILEVFADMEELGVKPDEDTVRRVAKAFERLGQVDNKKLVLTKYQSKWKYLHFNGERVRVRRTDGGIE